MSIFVIDKHPLMREAVGALIGRMGYTAMELDNVAAATQAVEAHGLPDLICVEFATNDGDGIAAIRDLRSKFPKLPIVVLTAADAHDNESLALEAGANAFVHKSSSGTQVAHTLREFLREEPAPGNLTLPERLSKRQKQLLKLLDKGMSNRDIAESLQISEHTVKVHLWRLFRRLNVKSRSQASHLARKHGLL